MTAPVDIVEGVPLGSLKRYLAKTGWRRSVLRDGAVLFAKGDGDQVEIFLPATPQVRDLREKLTSALATLTAMEERPSDVVAAAIRAISYDLVRSRLPVSPIRQDTIRLGTAEAFIRRMHGTLEAVAHAELHVGPFYQRVSTVAQRYADDCRFGHTFRGSFGFTVESPCGSCTLDDGEVETLALGGELGALPLERRAVQRLARGLRTVEAAIEQEDPALIAQGYQTGLNANAVEELTALVSEPQITEVHFQVLFSPEWGVPPDLGDAPAVTLGQARGVAVLQEAARVLRAVDYERRRTIVGRVRTLHSMDTPADLYSNSGLQDVIVEWSSEEFGTRNVRVSLGPEEYLQAVEAHTEGRLISVFGELDRTRQWRLENARDFRLL